MNRLSQEQQVAQSSLQSQNKTIQIKKKNKKKKKVYKIISSTYKKKKCQFYNRGSCTKGNQCTFNHNFTPDVTKKICKFFLSSSCTKGQSCQYSHNTKKYPCKFYHIQQNCRQSQNCRFSHGEIQSQLFDQFLKDNEDLLLKLYNQDKPLKNIYIEYIRREDLMKKQNKEKEQADISPFLFQPSTNQLNERINLIQKDTYMKNQIQDTINIRNQKQEKLEQNKQRKELTPKNITNQQKIAKFYQNLDYFLTSQY